jgi:hypothetical protein
MIPCSKSCDHCAEVSGMNNSDKRSRVFEIPIDCNDIFIRELFGKFRIENEIIHTYDTA